MSDRLPNFLIVGAPKAGTTAVYEALRRHPEFFLPGLKEPHFFSSSMGMDSWEDYVALFRAAGSRPFVGEASTNYLYDAGAPGRIREALGQVRIVAYLRHPIDQVLSMYHHNRRNELEDLELEEALEAEPGRMEDGKSPMLWYRSRAAYAQQLERYFSAFGRESVFVGFFDDLQANPSGLLGATLRFLGASQDVPLELPQVNRHGRARSRLLASFLRRPKPFLRPLSWLGPSAKNMIKRRVRDWNTRPASYEPMEAELRRELGVSLGPDIERLRSLLDGQLPEAWDRE